MFRMDLLLLCTASTYDVGLSRVGGEFGTQRSWIDMEGGGSFSNKERLRH